MITAKQYILDNFVLVSYTPFSNPEKCAACDMPSRESVESIPFCGRHMAQVKKAVAKFEREARKREEWNKGIAKQGFM